MLITASRFGRLGIAVVLGLGLAVGGASSPAAAWASPYEFAGVADWDRDGHQDLVAADADGLLWLYPGASVRGYSPYERVQIGHGWWNYKLVGMADWDRDGHQDIVARDPNGYLWLYRGASVRGYSPYWRVQIGNGWNSIYVAGVADWDGDGHQDLVGADANGLLWLYRGASVRGYSPYPRVQIGNGWFIEFYTGFTFAGLGDWDGDGNQDLVARDGYDGRLWLYRGASVRGYSPYPPVEIGNGWNPWIYEFPGIGDWDGDGHQDVVARDFDGDLWLYPGASVSDYSPYERVLIGNGW